MEDFDFRSILVDSGSIVHCRNSLLAFVLAFSYEIVFVFSPFPAFPGEIGHIHVAIPYVHSIGATVGHHIRP